MWVGLFKEASDKRKMEDENKREIKVDLALTVSLIDTSAPHSESLLPLDCDCVEEERKKHLKRAEVLRNPEDRKSPRDSRPA